MLWCMEVDQRMILSIQCITINQLIHTIRIKEQIYFSRKFWEKDLLLYQEQIYLEWENTRIIG